ncbi:dml-1 [Rhypophila decipiens]|uniref:Dml-1 n=1 Tax=Rhypophila decipiens TaxID=261697 RepID=A0AAN6YFA6_9PEZI|nr:dml-1 [Rhypophila decipiens]
MHEIITVQLGQQSNYLATHFWNTQESYFTYSEDPQEESPINHDTHWRPGVGADGSETYLPRTVIYDLKGGFGSMRKTNALYDDLAASENPAQNLSLWNGPTAVTKLQPIEQSSYQAGLEAGVEPPPLTTSSVRYWSDFNRVFYHPRSVVQLNDYEVNSSIMPFEKFVSGEELFGELDKEHDLLDRDLRLFAEEADQMQGIQIMASLDDAWGGFASRYLERLRDEYGKTVLWVWGAQDPVAGVSRDKRLTRLGNKARALSELYKHASIVVPLAVPQRLPNTLQLDLSSRWHTSALLASAVETITLPSRLKDVANRATLGTIADMLNTMGRQSIAGLQMSFDAVPQEGEPNSSEKKPHPSHVFDQQREDGNDIEQIKLDLDFSPSDQLDSYSSRNGFKKPKVFSQNLVWRGYPEDKNQDGDARMTDVDDDERERNRRRRPDETVTKSYKTPLSFPLLSSFPQIFRDAKTGEPLTGHVNITGSVSTDSSVSDRLKLLRTTVARSIGVEDRENLSNDLAEMADEYHEGWSSGSDEGEDD